MLQQSCGKEACENSTFYIYRDHDGAILLTCTKCGTANVTTRAPTHEELSGKAESARRAGESGGQGLSAELHAALAREKEEIPRRLEVLAAAYMAERKGKG